MMNSKDGANALVVTDVFTMKERWKVILFHGNGKQYFPDGESIKYEGHFRQGLYNGYGMLFDETNRS